MKRQHGVSIVNTLLVIGLAASVIALLIAAISPSAASGETRTELWVNAPSSISSMSPHARLATAGETRTDLWINHPSSIGSTSRSDTRLTTVGETRTDLWVNNPLSIGSTSRPDARLATLRVLN